MLLKPTSSVSRPDGVIDDEAGSGINPFLLLNLLLFLKSIGLVSSDWTLTVSWNLFWKYLGSDGFSMYVLATLISLAISLSFIFLVLLAGALHRVKCFSY